MRFPNFKTMRKSQASFEFLITYAWAFLIMAVVIGLFGYMGLQDMRTSVPDKCIFDQSFNCNEFNGVKSGDSFTITF